MIIIWILICIAAFYTYNEYQFYAIAFTVGMVMGGIQALSRATYSKLIPRSTIDTASYFSFYDVAEKIGIIIGMFLFGVIDQITGSMRYSIIFFTLFFVFGALLLLRVNRKPNLSSSVE